MTSLVFKPGKELTFLSIEHDRKRLASFFRGPHQGNSLLINLAEVNHCDSAGLALLIEAKRLAKQHNVPCHIEAIPRQISALAQFCGVQEILISNH